VRALATNRLWLRPFTDDDLEIHRVVFSDPEVCHFYCTNTRSEQETREWLIHRKWQVRNEDELGFLAVMRKHDQQLMGLVALQLVVATWLRFADAPETPFHPLIVELSYALGRAYQRQGYATEACQAVIDYGFQEMCLPRLTNGVVPENVASARLCARLGFRQVPNVHPAGTGQVWILDNPRLATRVVYAQSHGS
jgi:RimJ/RimL family protein N-acetyltransferase